MTRIIKTLTLAQIETLLDWAAAEGWNPGLGDARAFQAADPKGFFGSFVDGTMVSAISAVAYDAHFGFVGLYICHPDWRGQGHGKAVWDAGLDYLGGRTVGLDGVPEQQANYATMGFVPAYQTIRMSGTLAGGQASVEPLADLTEIRALDRKCFPAFRDKFLQHWLAPPNQGFVVREAGEVAAYGVARPCREGTKIGPLFARSTAAALAIVQAQSGSVHIDVPVAQTAFVKALSGLGFTPGFSTRRMYKGQPPSIWMEGVFGVSSLELG